MTVGNAEAIEEFHALTAEEQQARIEDLADQILVKQWDMKYRLYSVVKNCAEVILRLGLGDKYCSLSEKQTEKFFVKFFDDETAQTMFALDNLSPGIVSEVFATSSSVSLEDFNRYYRSTFPWILHRSNDFIKTLWQLFVKHGDPDFWSADRDPLHKGASGCIDSLLVQSAIVLQGVYGEDRVQSLILRMIDESPVSAIDFIRILQSDLDTSTIPLAWAVHVLNENQLAHEGIKYD